MSDERTPSRGNGPRKKRTFQRRLIKIMRVNSCSKKCNLYELNQATRYAQ